MAKEETEIVREQARVCNAALNPASLTVTLAASVQDVATQNLTSEAYPACK